MRISTYLIQIADTSFVVVIIQDGRWLLVGLRAGHSLLMLGTEEEDVVPPLWHIRDCCVGLSECKQRGEYLSLPDLQELQRELRFIPADGANQCIFPPQQLSSQSEGGKKVVACYCFSLEPLHQLQHNSLSLVHLPGVE